MKSFLVLLILLVPFQSHSKEITLDDLGYKKTEILGDPKLQETLDRRSSMLKTHQILALATVLPMVANYILGDEAGDNSKTRDAHTILGLTTAGLYFTSASFALFAPKPEGIEDKGNTKIHRALAWIHFPLMIITPILGNIARNQINHGNGEVSGAGELHGTAATVLLASYLASVAVMTFDF